MQQQDSQKITPQDASNLIQFSIASLCQAEKISYINQQGLDLLTQMVIDDIRLIAETARTTTQNSEREVTNTTDVALALNAHNIDLGDVTHYLSAPLRARVGLTATSSSSSSVTHNNNNNEDNSHLNNIPTPIPAPIEPSPQQYPVNFHSEQIKPLGNRLASVNGNLTSLSTQPTHRDLTHIPPYFPTPPSISPSFTSTPSSKTQQTLTIRQSTSLIDSSETHKRTKY